MPATRAASQVWTPVPKVPARMEALHCCEGLLDQGAMRLCPACRNNEQFAAEALVFGKSTQSGSLPQPRLPGSPSAGGLPPAASCGETIEIRDLLAAGRATFQMRLDGKAVAIGGSLHDVFHQLPMRVYRNLLQPTDPPMAPPPARRLDAHGTARTPRDDHRRRSGERLDLLENQVFERGLILAIRNARSINLPASQHLRPRPLL
jgi:hypothetical protein